MQFGAHNKCIKIESIKWNIMHDDFTSVFPVPVKFEICFILAPMRIFSLELLHITYYIYSPWKVSKRMRYSGLKYSGTRLRFLSTKN